MAIIHNLGFPRVGANRELKFALENYWQGNSTQDELLHQAAQLRERHWTYQKELDLLPVGDFSFYDQVLDMSFTLGNIPDRVKHFKGNVLDNYFRVARGRSAKLAGDSESCCDAVSAGEMTKWFDTNYHYIVPEFTAQSKFSLDASRLLGELKEAQSQGVNAKPVIIGPITYLALGKAKDGSNPLDLLVKLIPVYSELLTLLAEDGVEWVQIDEPILVTDLAPEWKQAFVDAYTQFEPIKIKVLLATYFGPLLDNRDLALSLPVEGLHIDAITAREEASLIVDNLANNQVLSLGVINGRNIWKTDLSATLDWLEPIAHKLGERLWLAPSCSLLHVPVDLDSELKLDSEIKSWLAFALQKLNELRVLSTALKHGRDAVREELSDNEAALRSRRTSVRVHDASVQERLKGSMVSLGQRQSAFEQRSQKQAAHLNLPLYPTTTIGSFPQTAEIRQVRSQYKSGRLDEALYRSAMQSEIANSVREQEALGLDVLVHGEAERNDMVEYFGEQLSGYAFSQFGWVQSYGSRCVKPPILFGDVARLKPMTIDWISYAQSLTDKPMKGMLTGPVTILNWSFVRDDQERSTTCRQIALAIRDEVLDLEKAGIRIIQIDEAALREGLPLRKSDWQTYLDWAIESFRIAANGVRDETQIHTHMCYSEFNDIIASIAQMDADVITIETSRSDMELLDAFERFNYPNEIGPGVYDIHSPNIPETYEIINLMLKASKYIAKERLWVNPDCGLKTRQWSEVIPALKNMVSAAEYLRIQSRYGVTS